MGVARGGLLALLLVLSAAPLCDSTASLPASSAPGEGAADVRFDLGKKRQKVQTHGLLRPSASSPLHPKLHLVPRAPLGPSAAR